MSLLIWERQITVLSRHPEGDREWQLWVEGARLVAAYISYH